MVDSADPINADPSSDSRGNGIIGIVENTNATSTTTDDIKTLLLSAAQNGEANVVEDILKTSDIRTLDVAGDVSTTSTLLYSASLHGHDEVVRVLIRHGAIDQYNDETTVSSTRQLLPLGAAIHGQHIDTVRVLVDAGINVNARDEEGDSALSVAAVYGDLEAARLLLSRGAEVHVVNNDGECPLLLAVGEGHATIAEMLLQRGADAALSDNDRASIAYEAAFKGHEQVLKVLLTFMDFDINTVTDDNTDGVSMLFGAAAQGNIGVIQTLLDHGADVNRGNYDNETALWVATQSGWSDIARLLVESGADVNATCDHGLSVLGVASQQQRVELATWLLNCGADPNIATLEAVSPLIFAVQARQHELVESLLEHGADTNARTNRQGLTALLIATQNDDLRSVGLLLDHGARPDTSDHQHGLAPIHIAARNGYREALELLLRHGASVNTKTQPGERTALNLAACFGRLDAVELLVQRDGVDIEARSSDGETALYAAAANEGSSDASTNAWCDVVATLVRRGANVDTTRSDGVSPLYAASLVGSQRMVQTLLERGARVNVGVESGASPLFIAARNGHEDVVKLLVMFGADVNVQPARCCAPLFKAVERGYRGIVEVLLNHGARLGPSGDRSGVNALMLAAQNGHDDVIDMLLSHGADINEAGINKRTPLLTAVDSSRAGSGTVEMLLERGADVNAATRHDVTPLFIGCQEGKLDVVRLLLEHGAAVDGPTRRKYNTAPVYMAARNGHTEILKLLIGHGARVNETAVDNATPLHVASTQGHLDAVQLLLRADANVNATTNNGYSPLMHATQNGHSEIVDALVRSNADVYAKNYRGETALGIATRAGHGQIASQLREKMNTEFKVFESLLLRPREHNHGRSSEGEVLPTASHLLKLGIDVDAEDLHGQRVLHRAAAASNSRIVVESLIKTAGANPDASDFFGNTALHEAACHCLESCSALLKHGALVNKRNVSGKTPLHIAIESRQFDIASMLLRCGANARLADDWLNTPFHFVEFTNDQTVNSAQRFDKTEHKIPSNKNVFGHTFDWSFERSLRHLNLCKRKGDKSFHKNNPRRRKANYNVGRIYGRVDVRSNAKRKKSSKPRRIDKLEATNVSTNGTLKKNSFHNSDDLGNTSLHRAAGVYDDNEVFPQPNNRNALVQRLIKDGADVNRKNIFGQTAVHVARDKETIKTLVRLSDCSTLMTSDNRGRNFWHLLAWRDEADSRELVSCALKSRVEKSTNELRVADAQHRLPLHYAAMKSIALARDLLKLSGSRDSVATADAFGRTPLHYSSSGGQERDWGYEKDSKVYLGTAIEQIEASFLESRQWKDNYKSRWSDTSWNLLDDLDSIAGTFDGLSSGHGPDNTSTRKLPDSLRPKDWDSVSYVWNIWKDGAHLSDVSSKNCYKDGDEQQVPAEPNDHGSLVAGVNDRVFTFVRKLLDGVGGYDQRCFAEVLPVGSAFEGTKIDYPNEFDFTVVLKNFSEFCRPYPSPELPPGVYRIRRNNRSAETDGKFDEFFDADGHLLTGLLKTRFETCLKYVIASAELWRDENCFEIDTRKGNAFYEFNPGKACTNLRLRCVGPVEQARCIHYGISIDIVPALHFPGWWPDDAIQHADENIKRNGCYLVLENPRNIYPWMPFSHDYGLISFAAAESEMLKRAPPVVRAAYVVGKKLMSSFTKYKFYTSLARKTAILYCIAQNNDDVSTCTGTNFDEIDRDELALWVQRLMRKLLQFVVQGFVPSYFMPEYHTSVWKFEKHLKYAHLRLNQHGISFRSLFAKDYSITHREKRLRDCQLDNILRALAYSHFIYWSVSADSAADVTPYFPDVEPLIETEAADLT